MIQSRNYAFKHCKDQIDSLAAQIFIKHIEKIF